MGSVDQWVSGSVDQRADCFETFIFVNDVVKASFMNATLKSVASVGQLVNGSMGQWLSGVSGSVDQWISASEGQRVSGSIALKHLSL